tara:strand:+ start:62 stop:244 length:183 start_codon:yes stop_codon:yes gene_type:complete
MMMNKVQRRRTSAEEELRAERTHLMDLAREGNTEAIRRLKKEHKMRIVPKEEWPCHLATG